MTLKIIFAITLGVLLIGTFLFMIIYSIKDDIADKKEIDKLV